MSEVWVLKEEASTRKRGVDIYFAEWAPIGPRSTEILEDAKKFGSRFEAMQSPAYTFPLSFYEPTKVEKAGEIK